MWEFFGFLPADCGKREEGREGEGGKKRGKEEERGEGGEEGRDEEREGEATTK